MHQASTPQLCAAKTGTPLTPLPHTRLQPRCSLRQGEEGEREKGKGEGEREQVLATMGAMSGIYQVSLSLSLQDCLSLLD